MTIIYIIFTLMPKVVLLKAFVNLHYLNEFSFSIQLL
jgi:hypothetical protein